MWATIKLRPAFFPEGPDYSAAGFSVVGAAGLSAVGEAGSSGAGMAGALVVAGFGALGVFGIPAERSTISKTNASASLSDTFNPFSVTVPVTNFPLGA